MLSHTARFTMHVAARRAVAEYDFHGNVHVAYMQTHVHLRIQERRRMRRGRRGYGR